MFHPMTGAVLRVHNDASLTGVGTNPSKRIAIVDGALTCIAAAGIKKTTVEDIAGASGMSRATLYRIFPGGRDAILQAVVETELARFYSQLAVAMGSAETLEDVLVAGIHQCAVILTNSVALSKIYEEEPWTVLRHGIFGEMDQTIAIASTFAEPFFGRWLEPDEARRAAELAVRVVVAYLVDPDSVFDLSSESGTRALVVRFVLPGIEALREI